MNNRELKIRYDAICDDLAKRRLKPAFDRLEKLINESGQLLFLDEWRNLDQTYHFMLKYTVEGIQDPERQKVYQKLIISVYELADKVYDAARLRFSSALEYEKKRSFVSTIDFGNFLNDLESYALHDELRSLVDDVDLKSESSLPDPSELQDKIVKLFYHIWFQNELKKEETEFVKDFLKSELVDVPYKAFIITGVLLSLLRYFDRSKFELLFEGYGVESQEVSQRALVALVLSFYRYDRRLVNYPGITSRLRFLDENPAFKTNLETVIVQLIRSKETEKIQKKITDEIIPEMIRISPNLKDKINLVDGRQHGRG